MNLTADKVREGIMTLKTISTRNLLLYVDHADQELKDLIGMELESRHDPVTGLGFKKEG